MEDHLDPGPGQWVVIDDERNVIDRFAGSVDEHRGHGLDAVTERHMRGPRVPTGTAAASGQR